MIVLPSKFVHEVLQAFDLKEPAAFYPRVDGTAFPRDQLDSALDALRLGDFVVIADWTQDRGQGYRLTDLGRAAVDQPALLTRPPQRAVHERASSGHPSEEVIRAVMSPGKPIVTPILLAVNVLVYVATCLFSMQQGLSLDEVLSGRMILPGALVPSEFYYGHAYWQLLTYMFLHGSPLHILFNMYALYSLGAVMEGRWGWKRYVLLYFGSGLLAGVAALLFAPPMSRGGTVGASGAIAGLLTSIGAWAYIHRRHLPPQFLQASYQAVGVNLVLLVIISLQPGISMSAHVGGAIAGAVLSLPLSWMGSSSSAGQKGLAVGVLVAIAVGAVVLLAGHAPAFPPQRVPW